MPNNPFLHSVYDTLFKNNSETINKDISRELETICNTTLKYYKIVLSMSDKGRCPFVITKTTALQSKTLSCVNDTIETSKHCRYNIVNYIEIFITNLVNCVMDKVSDFTDLFVKNNFNIVVASENIVSNMSLYTSQESQEILNSVTKMNKWLLVKILLCSIVFYYFNKSLDKLTMLFDTILVSKNFYNDIEIIIETTSMPALMKGTESCIDVSACEASQSQKRQCKTLCMTNNNKFLNVKLIPNTLNLLCINCVDCKSCICCYNCKQCISCMFSINLYHSENAYYCVDSINCYDSYYIYNSSKMFYCHKCLECSNCLHSDHLIQCINVSYSSNVKLLDNNTDSFIVYTQNNCFQRRVLDTKYTNQLIFDKPFTTLSRTLVKDKDLLGLKHEYFIKYYFTESDTANDSTLIPTAKKEYLDNDIDYTNILNDYTIKKSCKLPEFNDKYFVKIKDTSLDDAKQEYQIQSENKCKELADYIEDNNVKTMDNVPIEFQQLMKCKDPELQYNVNAPGTMMKQDRYDKYIREDNKFKNNYVITVDD